MTDDRTPRAAHNGHGLADQCLIHLQLFQGRLEMFGNSVEVLIGNVQVSVSLAHVLAGVGDGTAQGRREEFLLLQQQK